MSIKFEQHIYLREITKNRNSDPDWLTEHISAYNEALPLVNKKGLFDVCNGGINIGTLYIDAYGANQGGCVENYELYPGSSLKWKGIIITAE